MIILQLVDVSGIEVVGKHESDFIFLKLMNREPQVWGLGNMGQILLSIRKFAIKIYKDTSSYLRANMRYTRSYCLKRAQGCLELL